MYKKTHLSALTMLSLVAVVPLLSACHTTAGAGQDISATGKASRIPPRRTRPDTRVRPSAIRSPWLHA